MAIIEINLCAVTLKLTNPAQVEIEEIPEKAVKINDDDLAAEQFNATFVLPKLPEPYDSWLIGGVNVYVHGERWTKSQFPGTVKVDGGDVLEVTLSLQDNLAGNLKHKLGSGPPAGGPMLMWSP